MNGKIFLSMAALLWAAAEDLRCRRIPNGCIAVLAGLKPAELLSAVCVGTLQPAGAFWAFGRALLKGTIVFLLLMMLHVLTAGGIGMGDIKLFAVLGMAYGLRAAWRIFTGSFLLCAAVCAVLILTGQKNRRGTLPLGPFVCAGYLLMIFGKGIP